MPRRPFEIDREPSAPLSVGATARKYGVPDSAVHDVRAFVAHFLATPPRRTGKKGGKSSVLRWRLAKARTPKVRHIKLRSRKTKHTAKLGARKK